jgi:predicted metalloprotease with PDZ domain
LTRIILAALFATTIASAQQPIRITADLSDVARKIYTAEIDIPVKTGPLVVTMPKWIPGNHAPSGPIADLISLVFTANDKTINFRRDDVDMFEFHLDIPAGVTNLHVHLASAVSARATDQIAVLEWERLMMYPAHIPVAKIPIQPTVIAPTGWGIGTALTPVGAYDPNAKVGGSTEFATTNVEQLEDSPVVAGHFFHEFALAPEISPKHYIDVVSDEPADSNLRPEFLAEVSNLVREASAAYASHHYNAYHFLLTLSDVAGGEGLEHGQSSDNGVGELGFADASHQRRDADLLAHEFTHSWNGKYRRPATLYQPDFATPQEGELLWVYEGMTQYMGNVLAARAGLKSQEQYRANLATSAANLDEKPGRLWRTTDDTAIASSISRRPAPAWAASKRGQDYYQEGELLWLDADTKIRELTNDQKTLTDFQHIFLGKGGNTGPLIVPYTREELIHDLNEVAKFDWATFLHDRIDLVNPHVDLEGITRGGYKLVYQDHPTKFDRDSGRVPTGPNVWYSLGLRLGPDGTITDVRWGSPADKAKLAPGQKILAINGHIFTFTAAPSNENDPMIGANPLHDAIIAAKAIPDPIHLLIQTESWIRPMDLDYHDGERFPVMVRVDNTKDYLDEITTSLTKPTK